MKSYRSVIAYFLIIPLFLLDFAQFSLAVNKNLISNTNIQNDSKKSAELPLEVSEKYYKKEAILKFNEAVKQWELKNTDKAISLWNEAVKIDPKLWVGYLGLGQAYDSIKEYSKSLEAYNKYLELAPKQAPDRSGVVETAGYLNHLLRHGEKSLIGNDYLDLVKTKHQGKDHYVRWNLDRPVKIYFYPAKGIPNYRNEFQKAFIDGANIWKEVLLNINFQIIDNSILEKLSGKEKEKKEKELIESAQVKVIFPSRFKIKGDPGNPVAAEIDAQSFPIIRDKKNFRVLGVIMVSPFIYFQSKLQFRLNLFQCLVLMSRSTS